MRRLLIVTFPPGPLFREFVRAGKMLGYCIKRIVFDAGDYLETPRAQRLVYSGSPDDWPSHVAKLLADGGFDSLLVFNDTGIRNRPALQAAEKLGLDRFIIENGYLGPGTITLERHGVNANSHLSRLAFPKDGTGTRPFTDPVAPLPRRHQAIATSLHDAAAILGRPLLPRALPTSTLPLWRQALGHAKGIARRAMTREAAALAAITTRRGDRSSVFTLILQKPGDSQLLTHAIYGSNASHLSLVLSSFAASADQNDILIVKEHPLDDGREKLRAVFDKQCRALGLDTRCFYLCATALRDVLDRTDALITINSSVGLAALSRNLPVLCLGNAFYDRADLTFEGSLDLFWKVAPHRRPDPRVTHSFLSMIARETQIAGGFYRTEDRAILVPSLIAALSGEEVVSRCDENAVMTG
jgi:capsular polysaccharide export protein